MGLNKLCEVGARSFVPSWSLSNLSHPMQTRPSLFTHTSSLFTIIRQLDSKFSIKDLGMLSFYCGVEVLATSMSLPLSKQKYVIDLLNKRNMLDSKLVSTLLVVGNSLTAQAGTAPVNATTYHQVVGGLQHLWMTRPSISFALN